MQLKIKAIINENYCDNNENGKPGLAKFDSLFFMNRCKLKSKNAEFFSRNNLTY